jgi:long-chain acyl-CoA synthetase
MMLSSLEGGIRVNLIDLLEHSVRAHGGKECLRYKQGDVYVSMTYDEFWKSILACVGGLRQIGVKAGDKVGILANNCPQWAVSDYAVLAIGAVVVPVYPTLPADQVEYILTNAEVSVCIVEDEQQYAKIHSRRPPNLELAVVIRHENMHDVETSGLPWHRFDELITLGHEVPWSKKSPADIDAGALATIVHTSGTSGQPKGVMLTHRNLVSNVKACLDVTPVYPTDVGLSYLPLSHIFERTVGQFAALSAGSCIAYAENIESIPKNILEVRPTILVTVPRLLEKVYGKVMDTVAHLPSPIRSLLQSGIREGKSSGLTYRLVDRLVYQKIRRGLGGRMRLVVSGGAALSAEVAHFFLRAGIPVVEGYGMTESAPVICVNPPHDIRPGTVGKPVEGVTVRLAEDGELLVQGPNVMVGYYRNEEATQEALEDGWLHTGDIAEIEDEYVKIVDRKKHILVLATGKNVAPAPIEAAIMTSSYVSSAILIGDGRKYVTCLLSPNIQELRPVAAKLDLPDHPESWVTHPEIRNLYAREVERRTRSFAPFEQPKRAILIAEELSVESGDLTPSLKVRNKIVMAKYARQIEAMYEGADFIPLLSTGHDGDDSTTHEDTPSSPSIPSGEGPTTSPPRRTRRRGLYFLVGGVAVVVLASMAVLNSPHLPKNLDILSMVKGIHNTNSKISNENNQIVSSLQHIDQLAGSTKTMSGDLQTLSAGVGTDKAMLSQLQELSRQEVDLSQQFYGLAQKLHTDLASIGESSGKQNQSTKTMNTSAQSISSTLSQLTNVNRQISGQLQTADSKARVIADEMP